MLTSSSDARGWSPNSDRRHRDSSAAQTTGSSTSVSAWGEEGSESVGREGKQGLSPPVGGREFGLVGAGERWGETGARGKCACSSGPNSPHHSPPNLLHANACRPLPLALHSRSHLHDARQHKRLQAGPAHKRADAADALEESGAQRRVAVVEERDEQRQKHVVGVLREGQGGISCQGRRSGGFDSVRD